MGEIDVPFRLYHIEVIKMRLYLDVRWELVRSDGR